MFKANVYECLLRIEERLKKIEDKLVSMEHNNGCHICYPHSNYPYYNPYLLPVRYTYNNTLKSDFTDNKDRFKIDYDSQGGAYTTTTNQTFINNLKRKNGEC